jgi:hypothetical protein
MHPLRFAVQTSSNGVVERDFTLGEVTGVLWSPASGSEHAPLVLMGHGGGLHKKTPQLLDALRQLPEIGTEAPIGYGGGITLRTGIGIPGKSVGRADAGLVACRRPWHRARR